MLPSLAAVLKAHDWVVRRYVLDRRRDDAGIADGLRHADDLSAARPLDEPAALLFALTLRPRALGEAWERLPLLLVVQQARALNAEIVCDPNDVELQDLRLRVVVRRATFDDVRAWVVAHLRPLR